MIRITRGTDYHRGARDLHLFGARALRMPAEMLSFPSGRVPEMRCDVRPL